MYAWKESQLIPATSTSAQNQVILHINNNFVEIIELYFLCLMLLKCEPLIWQDHSYGWMFLTEQIIQNK